MSPDAVADVGNTRLKWSACRDGVGPVVSAADDERAWADAPRGAWVIASVRPERSERFAAFLHRRGDSVRRLTHADVPLRADVESLERVGIDRLLNAVAAAARVPPGEPAAMVDAGSAVTVDLLDGDGTFRGGSIFPGLDLMAEALHRYTALLPRVEVTLPLPPLPGRATVPAIQRGVYHAVIGGIKDIVAAYGVRRVFLTGGQGPLLADGLPGVEPWPEMTLFGVWTCARAMT